MRSKILHQMSISIYTVTRQEERDTHNHGHRDSLRIVNGTWPRSGAQTAGVLANAAMVDPIWSGNCRVLVPLSAPAAMFISADRFGTLAESGVLVMVTLSGGVVSDVEFPAVDGMCRLGGICDNSCAESPG